MKNKEFNAKTVSNTKTKYLKNDSNDKNLLGDNKLVKKHKKKLVN